MTSHLSGGREAKGSSALGPASEECRSSGGAPRGRGLVRDVDDDGDESEWHRTLSVAGPGNEAGVDLSARRQLRSSGVRSSGRPLAEEGFASRPQFVNEVEGWHRRLVSGASGQSGGWELEPRPGSGRVPKWSPRCAGRTTVNCPRELFVVPGRMPRPAGHEGMCRTGSSIMFFLDSQPVGFPGCGRRKRCWQVSVVVRNGHEHTLPPPFVTLTSGTRHPSQPRMVEALAGGGLVGANWAPTQLTRQLLVCRKKSDARTTSNSSGTAWGRAKPHGQGPGKLPPRPCAQAGQEIQAH